MSDELSHERRVDEAIAEYLQALDEGKPVDLEVFLASHADVAEEVRAYLNDQTHARGSLDKSRVSPRGEVTPTLVRPGGGRENPRNETSRSMGDYELLEEIARGGMGVVWKARQRRLNRIVALKMILNAPVASAEDLNRFRLEAEAAARLDHPHIVPIHEIGDDEGRLYFSMKYIEGGSLSDHLSHVSWSTSGETVIRRFVQILVDVARAVHHAHQHSILHRDLKPGNILLGGMREGAGGKDLVPYVTDFGLAKRLEVDSQLTQSGAVVGTPSYMAPEQAAGQRDLGPGVDVYSLGAILYQILTGRKPFQAATPMATLLLVQSQDVVAPRVADGSIDPLIETICLKCLDKDPKRRYPTAQLLADDLSRWLRSEPILARRAPWARRAWHRCRRHPWLVASALVVLLVLINIGVLLVNGRNGRPQPTDTGSQERIENYAALLTRAFERLDQRTLAEDYLKQCPEDLRGWEWHYLWNRAGEKPLRLGADAGIPFDVCFAEESSKLASGHSQKCAFVWNITSGKEVARLEHENHIEAVSLDRAGQLLMSGGQDDGMAHVWNVAERTRQSWKAHDGRVFQVLLGSTGDIGFTRGANLKAWRLADRSMLWSANASSLLGISSDESTIYLAEESDFVVREAMSGREVARKKGIQPIAAARNGTVMLGKGKGHVVHVWTMDKPEPIGQVTLESEAWRAAFDAKGERFAVVTHAVPLPNGKTRARFLSIHRAEGARLMHRQLAAHVFAAAFDSQFNHVALGINGGVEVWNLDRAPGLVFAGAGPLTFQPQAPRLAFRNQDGRVALVNIDEGSKALVPGAAINARVAFSPNGRLRAAPLDEKSLQIRDANNDVLGSFEVRTDSPFLFADDTAIIAATSDGKLRCLKLDGGERWSHMPSQTYVLASAPGRVAIADAKQLKACDASTGRILQSTPLPSQAQSVAISLDGDSIAVACQDNGVLAVDRQGSTRKLTNEDAVCLGFVGGRVAVAGSTLAIHDPKTGVLLLDLKVADVRDLAADDKGNWLAVTDNKSVTILNGATGR